MKIELGGVQFGQKVYSRASLIWNHRYDFGFQLVQLPLYYTHFDITKFSRSNAGVFSLQLFYWSSTQLVFKKLQELSFIFLQFDWWSKLLNLISFVF